MNNIILFFRKISLRKFVLFSIITCLLISLIITFIISYIDIGYLEIDYLENKGLAFIFIITVLVTPVLETLIFQYGVIELFFKLKNKNKVMFAALTSAFLFSLSHYYNLLYILGAFILGLGFAFFYIVAKRRKDINPFWLLTCIHSLLNLVAFIANDIF